MTGWVIGSGREENGRWGSDDTGWLILATDQTFWRAKSRTAYENQWTPIEPEVHLEQYNVLDLDHWPPRYPWFPYGNIHLPNDNRPRSFVEAIPRRLDELCIEHGLKPVSKK